MLLCFALLCFAINTMNSIFSKKYHEVISALIDDLYYIIIIIWYLTFFLLGLCRDVVHERISVNSSLNYSCGKIAFSVKPGRHSLTQFQFHIFRNSFIILLS